MGTLCLCFLALESCASRNLPAARDRAHGATSSGASTDDTSALAARHAFTCNPSARPKQSALQRLSRLQYSNALRDLVAAMVTPDLYQAAWEREVKPLLAHLPHDTVSKHAPFSTMDQAVTQQHVDAYATIAHHAARSLTKTPERVSELLACKPGESPETCVISFMQRFAHRAYRRPVNGDDLTFLHNVYGARGIDPVGLRDVIQAVLTSPFFIYRVELSGTLVPGKRGVVALSDHELAAKLALTFWQTGPDHIALQAADRGELTTDEGYERELDRVLRDPRAEEGYKVFVREWLNLEELREMNALAGDPVFEAVRGKTQVSHDLREAMIEDVVGSFVYHVTRDDPYSAFFISPYSFAQSNELAAIYGVPRWDGQGEPPAFPPGERAGLLTRAALVATGTVNTRPIMKGVFVRERLLCDRLPAPPANAASGLLDLSPTDTTREQVEKLTEHPEACAFCHSSRINALGFATENYDSLGRMRSEQKLFEKNGKVVGARPIDTKSVPHIWPDDERVSSGAADLADMIRTSGKGEKCFVQQYTRFALGRKEDESADGCLLEDVRAALESGAGLRESMRVLAKRPEFRQRFVGEMQ